jgi:hypothetical protein
VDKADEGDSSVAEALLRGQAGPPAVIGSSTVAGYLCQRALLEDFMDSALGAAPRVGDALVAAQREAALRAAAATSDAREETSAAVRCYTVLGDPAMRLVSD